MAQIHYTYVTSTGTKGTVSHGSESGALSWFKGRGITEYHKVTYDEPPQTTMNKIGAITGNYAKAAETFTNIVMKEPTRNISSLKVLKEVKASMPKSTGLSGKTERSSLLKLTKSGTTKLYAAVSIIALIIIYGSWKVFKKHVS